jgi:hypothetical protein
MHIGKAAVGPNYIVKVGGRNYPTDANGKIEIDGEVVIEIKSFFNTNSTNQNKTLVVYVDKLVEKEIYPANGIIYSEENIILDNAQTLPSPGLTTISERNIYIKGDYNTETWQPSSAIAAGLNYLLSDQFNYPQTLPDTFQNLESPYAEDFVEGRQNWYADHYQTMANAVDKDYRYVVSLVGYYGYMPETLERWWEYKSPGDLMTAPSDVVEHKREVIGALTRLPKDNFPINSLLLDLNKKGTRARTADGWPTNMGSVVPEDAQNFFSYDSHYLDPSNLKPPGDFMADNVKINLQIKSDRWSVSIPELY